MYLTFKSLGKWTSNVCNITTDESYVVDGLTVTAPTGVGVLAHESISTSSIGPSANVTSRPDALSLIHKLS